MNIRRHDDQDVVGTELDPIEDLINFFSTLKSHGFVEDLLRETHNFSDKKEISKTSKLIALHTNTAIGLAEQGLSGNPETSFLSLYYSTLNLSKIYLLLLKKRKELEKNRWHGAKYSEKEMNRNFLNEEIHIHNKGTIPLIYNSVSKKTIGKTGISVRMDEIYQNITSISAEYNTILKKQPECLCCQIEIVRDDENGHYLKVHTPEYSSLDEMPSIRKIPAFSSLTKANNGNEHFYTSKKIHGNFQDAQKKLKLLINRYLLNDYYQVNTWRDNWFCITPINGKKHVFNEELSIMLAYFHLSNVVRYNPEHLYKLMDSKYWVIILALRKHGFFRFSKLMWGNFTKKSFTIH